MSRRLKLIREIEKNIADLEAQIQDLIKDKYLDEYLDEYLILLSRQLSERKKLREFD